jgi:hypothetical protein
MQVVPIESLNYTQTVNNGERDFINKGAYFLVKDYEDSPEALKFIEKFIEKNRDKDFASFDNYSMIFYKESSKTNLEEIKLNPKSWDHYSNEHDRIFEYLWHKGKFAARYKLKNGLLIEPKTEVELGPQLPLTDSIK